MVFKKGHKKLIKQKEYIETLNQSNLFCLVFLGGNSSILFHLKEGITDHESYATLPMTMKLIIVFSEQDHAQIDG